MSDELTPANLPSAKELLSRRRLFKFAARVGSGLIAFIPAAEVLLQNIPNAEAATISRSGEIPNYIKCSRVECSNNGCSFTQPYSCYDAVLPGRPFCCCATCSSTTACIPGC